MSQFKYKVRQLSLFNFLKLVKDNYQLMKWKWLNKPMPPPYFVKRRIIRVYAKRFKTPIFFETGTAAGDTIAAVRSLFKKIFSVEINKFYFENAKKRFAGRKNIEIIHGDSGKILSTLLNDKIKDPTLFWLDGHYNSTEDLKSDEQICPIFQELECIFTHAVKNHVILIDDARLFIGTNGYPSLEEVKSDAVNKRPDLLFYVQEDIIRIHKK